MNLVLIIKWSLHLKKLGLIDTRMLRAWSLDIYLVVLDKKMRIGKVNR